MAAVLLGAVALDACGVLGAYGLKMGDFGLFACLKACEHCLAGVLFALLATGHQ